MSDEAVRDLATRAGVLTEWQDYAGGQHTVAPEVLCRILEALGLPSTTRGELLASRRLVGRRSTVQSLPPLVTATAGRPTRLDVGAGEPHAARLVLESGEARDITLVPARGRLRLPAIPESGYHRLLIDDRDIVVAVAPGRCHTIDDEVPDARLWGIAAQVYALRCRGDGGIGDAAGIAALAEAAGSRGADVLALSPLHALFSADPTRFSPYAPSTRLFKNPLHAAPALVFGEAFVSRVFAEAGLVDAFERLEALPLIEWPAASRAKFALLRALFDAFAAAEGSHGALAADFARFRADGGEPLTQHAVFEVLHCEQSARGVSDWRRWPVDLRDPASAAVGVFAAGHERDVRFHCFLQWLTDRSLGIAQGFAREAGMRMGLVCDLAVGMDPSGSHAWSRQNEVLGGLTIGAPPDLFNPRGQDWGLTGFSPRALLTGGFVPFLLTLRAALRHAGGVRIDHAMGLGRLWVLPQGAEPADGAYLAYPLTDLLRLLALESQRHQAIVIGEDLGTVPAGFHDMLEMAGVLGTRVLWFERAGRRFIAPSDWDRTAAAMTSTHDLPTVAGWWHGSDISTRAQCGRLGPGVREADLARERSGEREALWQAFTEAAVAGGPVPVPTETDRVADAALSFVARSDAPLFLPTIEDVLGQEEQPNLPGTGDEHPNWRRRLPLASDRLLAHPRVDGRIAAMAAERPRP